MRTLLYNAVRRTMPQDARTRLKQRVAHVRRRLAPVYRARFGSVTADQLVGELAARIDDNVEIIMVHSSFNDLQPIYVEGIRELMTGLDRLAGDRTLVMPAFFFGKEGDAVGYYRENPLFDVRRQPSQMGLLSEAFRRRRDVVRSLHPTHSVCAAGPLAEALVHGHHLAPTTFGEGTPFAFMASRRTAIVGLGTLWWRCLTHFHTAEDFLGEEFPLELTVGEIPVGLRDEHGQIHPYSLRVRRSGLRHNLQLLEPLVDEKTLQTWKYRGIPLFVADAQGMTSVLVDLARDGETVYLEQPIRRRVGAGRNR